MLKVHPDFSAGGAGRRRARTNDGYRLFSPPRAPQVHLDFSHGGAGGGDDSSPRPSAPQPRPQVHLDFSEFRFLPTVRPAQFRFHMYMCMCICVLICINLIFVHDYSEEIRESAMVQKTYYLFSRKSINYLVMQYSYYSIQSARLNPLPQQKWAFLTGRYACLQTEKVVPYPAYNFTSVEKSLLNP